MIPNEFLPDEKFKISDTNFKVAFTIEGITDRQRKDDPRYVKQYVRYFGEDKNAVRNFKLIEFHECTDSDYELFNPLMPIY